MQSKVASSILSNQFTQALEIARQKLNLSYEQIGVQAQIPLIAKEAETLVKLIFNGFRYPGRELCDRLAEVLQLDSLNLWEQCCLSRQAYLYAVRTINNLSQQQQNPEKLEVSDWLLKQLLAKAWEEGHQIKAKVGSHTCQHDAGERYSLDQDVLECVRCGKVLGKR